MNRTTLEKRTNLTFLNKNIINSNSEELINFYLGEASKETFSDKKEIFIRSLNALQKTKIPYKKDTIDLVFDNDDLTQHLIDNFMIDIEDVTNNKHIFLPEEREEIIYKVNMALNLIALLHKDLHELIVSHIGAFYFAKKEGFGGGSVSGLVGMIWLNPPSYWNIVDYAEAIYHEFIHNSLFLDDMVNCIFPNPDRKSVV